VAQPVAEAAAEQQSSAANKVLYPSTIHCRPVGVADSERWMFGTAR